MAADSEKDASEGLGGAQNTGEEDHIPGSSRDRTEADKRIRKQECQRNSYGKKKKKNESTEKDVGTLKEQLAYSNGQRDAYKDAYYKGIQEGLGKVVNSVGEVVNSVGEAVNSVGEAGKKQTAQTDKLCELLIEGKHFAGRREYCRGSTSSSKEVLEGAPNPMAMAMTSNGSVMSGSFKPCQSLPDECNQLAFNSLMERYIASETRHAQEMANTEARHALEMANTETRHAQEMAAVRTEYGLDVENDMLQALAGASPGFDFADQFVNYK